MSKVKVTALEPFNNFRPGDRFWLSEREAEQAQSKGLVTLVGGATADEPEPAATGTATRPPRAAGRARQSSASPAARASRQRTAKQSGDGEKKDPPAE